jgi:uncharacterized protein (TIGR02328 family)
MRLWHYKLIPHLPYIVETKDRKLNQLGGLWSEGTGMLGNGWGTNHSVVNYVWNHPESMLIRYMLSVHNEMIKRGGNPNWDRIVEALMRRHGWDYTTSYAYSNNFPTIVPYPEHNDKYLIECLENLKAKGIDLYSNFNGQT